MIRRARHAAGFSGRRGTVAVMTALMLPALLGAAGLAIDLGAWYRESVRLQLAADAGAEGAARLLSAQTATTSQFQAAALLEANGVTGGTMIGTLHTPVTVSVKSDWSQVTVTLTTTANIYFANAVGLAAPSITASATAGVTVTPPAACVLALSGTASPAIQVDNAGSIVATGCPIFSDSTAAKSIYLNSGTLKGTSVGSAGGVITSNSGSNTLSPSPGVSYAASESDPFSAMTVPSYGSCNYSNNPSFTAWQATPYQFTQSANVFCGNTTIGGNGTSDTFAPGTYYVVNGNLTFNNADVTSATGVTFVLTGTSPGAFSWTNYSNTTTMTAPTTGTLAGILVWQTCNSSGSDPASTFAGGSTLQATGTIYTPCGALDLSNNIKLTANSGGSFGVVAQTIYATGSASLSTTASGSGSSSSTVQIVLLQ
jgi:Flp pilus assembly protein TadG